MRRKSESLFGEQIWLCVEMSYNVTPWGLLQELEGSIWELWLGRVVPDETHKVQHLHFTNRKIGSSRLHSDAFSTITA